MVERAENKESEYKIVNLMGKGKIKNQDVDAVGWGSDARAIFDPEGKLQDIKREPTSQDAQAAASYMSYLLGIFEQLDK